MVFHLGIEGFGFYAAVRRLKVREWVQGSGLANLRLSTVNPETLHLKP